MSQPLPQIVDEARRLVVAAAERGVPVRLVGGLAVRMRADEAFHPGLSREYADIDLVHAQGQEQADDRVPRGDGIRAAPCVQQPQRQRTACSFTTSPTPRQLDVFVGSFRMCHEIPSATRLTLDPVTLPLAELLLTKLQIVKLNEKDLRDIIAILHHHAVGQQDGETINAARIATALRRGLGPLAHLQR